MNLSCTAHINCHHDVTHVSEHMDTWMCAQAARDFPQMQPVKISRVLAPEPFIPKILTAEELEQAEEAFHFDLRSDFDEMYGREEFEEEEHG